MAAPIQSDVRTFEQGVIESISEYARTNSFNSAQEVWLMPGYEGVLGEYGPYTEKEHTIDSFAQVYSAITAKDSSGNVLRVAHSANAVRVLNADGTLGNNLKLSVSGSRVSYTVYNDKILCFDGATTPFQITIAPQFSGTITTTDASPATTLIDTGATFTTDGIAAGWVVRNTVDGSSGIVVTVDSQTQITHTALSRGTDNNWDTSDTYDFIEVTDIGVDQPDVSNASTSDNDAAGNVKGTVKYYISQMSSSTEGALSVAFGEIDASLNQDGQGTQITVDLSHADFSTNTYRLYRTYANREAPNYLATVIGGQTYVDNIVDDDLGDLPRLHGDPPPAAITSAAVYNDVIYGVAGNTLYWSDPGEEESWWTATDGNSLSLDRGDGDVGKALFVEPDGVVIFKRHHILKLLGSGPADYRLVPITPSDQASPSVGTESSVSLCGVPGGAFFYYEDGFYVYSQGQVQRVSEAIDRLFFYGSVHAVAAGVVVGYDPRFGIVHCGLKFQTPSGKGSVQVLTLAFHVQTRRWLGVGKVVTGLTGFVITAMMYDPEQGEFSQWEYDDTGIVSNMRHYWVAPDQDLGLPSNTDLLSTTDAQLILPRFYGQTEFTEKRFLWVEIEALGTASADGTMKVEYSINGSAYATAGTATLSATRAKRRFNIGEYGREMDIRLTMDEGFRIYRAICGFQEFGSKSV